ncbi:hypothetical protein TWF694_010713 [Orbilia ellipsospora]|uniref:Dienelactone hydrolase domain-containing protein n=1 Tax=Orbilia ellipsospora TaxID=2528407 RepID=A0AAV9X783_9PEZI
MDQVCKACQTIPPVVDQDSYQEKGHYEEIGGINCYVAAPNPTPKTGIVFIYDIFGYFKQTLQGADILALTDPGHVVIMPDYFFGKPYDLKRFPPKTEDEKAAFGSFFSKEAGFPLTTETTKKVVTGLKEKFPEITKWGIFGLCWGGKAATLISGGEEAGIKFTASGQAHPAMLDFEQIKSLGIPHICLSSKDENQDVAKQVVDHLTNLNGSHSAIYADNIHGWMGARSDLKNQSEKDAFEKGYTEVVEFFKKALA